MQNQVLNAWQKVKLGDVTDISYGQDMPINQLTSSGFPVYGGNGLIGYSAKYLFETPKIIVGCRGENSGNVFFTQPKSFVTHNSLILNISQDIDTKFLYYAILASHIKEQTVTGSAQPQITINEISRLELNIPALEIQKKIATILSTLDNKIELNNKIATNLEEISQAIFKECLVNKKDWRTGKIGELVNIKNGYAFKSKDYKSVGVPIVRTLNFTNSGSIVLDSVVYLSPDKAEEYNNFYLDKFDLLLVMVGASLGKTVICPSNILPALQNQNMWSFKPINEKYRFYNNLLLKKVINEQRRSATGSARDFFRKDYFYSLDVQIPDVKTIENFNNIVKPIYLKSDQILGENQKLATTRDLLLPKLMKGEIRV